MKVFENKEIERASNTIDKFVQVALHWAELSKKQIENEFSEVFFESRTELIKHLIGKWESQDKDIARFYLGLDEKCIRQLFDYYNMDLEAAKYEDSVQRSLALMQKKSKWEVFPFERQIVNKFYLMANNNSLELLTELFPTVEDKLKDAKIDFYGNGRNWSLAWGILNGEQKLFLANYIIITKF